MTERLDEIAGMLKAHGARFEESAPSADKRLRLDLHLDGDGAAAFMNAFATHYAIDMAGFDNRRFFSVYPKLFSRPDLFDLVWLLRLLNKTFDHAWRDALRYEISVAHLLAVAERGCWFDPALTPHPTTRVSDDPANPVTRTLVDIGWSVATLPFRLLSLSLTLIGIAMLAGMLWMLATAAVAGNWWRVLEMAIGLAFPLFILTGIAISTAAKIQNRFGDQDPRTVARGLVQEAHIHHANANRRMERQRAEHQGRGHEHKPADHDHVHRRLDQ